ncbi:hypothetical protein SeMB42_g07598 [Synchytrium endobioticum]|uniref:Tubulin/FtsZ GTPase domain-containing protein n=1 Tax=Synchytrium endobioticum TaxID=286115 RepID=A0A507CJE3_9FUNG|nr:hypothetical protein SeMB42_g07596 [Synchytrium endobioticum]TPX32576.1 hypothetical protein SeMB42_g07598 [Synchytrium endobioticum]TPX38406.1 hypothetical protein SeLEV6574_g07801 [Synchytrium endobioticum]
MTSKQVITLQFGHFSNFVGTHIWNIQEAYFSSSHVSQDSDVDHNVLFRSVQTKHGDSYEPRLVLFDLQGSFGALKRGGELRETRATVDTWSGQVETYEHDPYPQNPFLQYQTSLGESSSDPSTLSTPFTPQSLNQLPIQPSSPPPPTFSDVLDASVHVWSDFSKLVYHPKSIAQLSMYSHENDISPFALFGQGRDVWKNRDFREDIIDDRIRFFLEDSDSLQGFQILTNTNDGFGGLASCVMDAILDDMPKASLMTYGISEARDPIVDNVKDYKTRMWENVNQMMCLKYLKDASSVYIPVCSPLPSELDPNGWSKHLRPKFHLPYHTSAYLASLIETASLLFRIYTTPLYIQDVASLISSSNYTKIAAMSGAVPVHQIQDETTMRLVLQYNPRAGHKFPWIRDSTLRVGYDQVDHENGQYAVLRGIGSHLPPEARSRIPAVSKQQEALDEFCASFPTPAGGCLGYVMNQGLPISDAFPQMFNSGDTISTTESALVRIHTPSRIKNLLQSAILQIDTLPPSVMRPLERVVDSQDGGLSLDELKDIKEDFQETAAVYNEIC